MATKRVLILEHHLLPSIFQKFPWSDFIDEDDDIELYILTSTDGLTEKDKSCKYVRAYEELVHPTTDGKLELLSLEMHKKYSFTHVYTKSEDFIMRAAHIRSLIGIDTGLTAESVAPYRDKVQMKLIASQGGFPVPPFTRIYTPATLIGFIEKYGYPVVVKSILGRGTSGVRLLKTKEDLEKFLSEDLFDGINSQQRVDLVGEFIVEKFVSGRMFHINGIAQEGKIICAWPFTYISTCLDFVTNGLAYGNSSVPRSNPLHDRLRQTAQRLLEIFPALPKTLAFHIELFENPDKNHLVDDDFVLCEIAARGPGGTIRKLIDMLSFDKDKNQSFSRLEFRASVSLPILPLSDVNEEMVVTDLIVPLKKGKLMYIPQECPIEHLFYMPLMKVEKSMNYEKFNTFAINSACIFIANTKTMEEGKQLVERGLQWFESESITMIP